MPEHVTRLKEIKEKKKRRSKSIRAGSTWGVLSIEKIAERCLLGPSARVTLNRRGYGRMEKTKNTNEIDGFNLSDATTRRVSRVLWKRQATPDLSVQR